MAIRAIDRVTISFGLVSIPTKIYSTGHPSEDISFHLLHAKDGSRLKQQYVCAKDGEVVTRGEMVKGYEYSKGHFVELTDEELDALDAVASNAIDIKEFVPLDSIDPIYLEKAYYLGPDSGGEKAYALLARALREQAVGGIASYAARGKSYVVLVRPYEDGLAMFQLHYPDEIRKWDEVPIGKLPRVEHKELALAEKVVEQLVTKELHLDKYRDEVKERVRAKIDEKLETGEQITAPEAPERGQVIDLMEALKKSLGSPHGTRSGGGRRVAGRRTKARN